MIQQCTLMDHDEDSALRQSSSPEILPDEESGNFTLYLFIILTFKFKLFFKIVESNDGIITSTAVRLSDLDLTVRNQAINSPADTEERSGRNVSSTRNLNV